MFFNSFVMATGIATLSVVTSLMAAYGLVYFKIRVCNIFFWLIFVTLLVPLELRVMPTYVVMSKLNMLNSFAGLNHSYFCIGNSNISFSDSFINLFQKNY
jgi:sn-glycerol 3-phosphate transport system permease protein